MAYDEVTDRFYMFGGQSRYVTLAGLWSFDLASAKWEQIGPSSGGPAGRADPMLVYVSPSHSSPSRDFLFLNGGWYNDSMGNVGRYSDTWFFFPRNGTWDRVRTSESPPPTSDSAVAFDPVDDLVLMYGGYNGTYNSNLWAFFLNDSSWHELHARSSANPPPLADARMQYDEREKIFVMFGGNNNLDPSENYNHYNSTWTFDLSTLTWERMLTSQSPPSRDYAHFAYDRDFDVFLLFGGYGEEIALADTWVYSATSNTWTDLAISHSPPPRFAGSMAYDSREKTFILYGGTFNHTYLGDTWSLVYEQPLIAGKGPYTLVLGYVAVGLAAAAGVFLLWLARRSPARRPKTAGQLRNTTRPSPG